VALVGSLPATVAATSAACWACSSARWRAAAAAAARARAAAAAAAASSCSVMSCAIRPLTWLSVAREAAVACTAAFRLLAASATALLAARTWTACSASLAWRRFWSCWSESTADWSILVATPA